MTVEEYRNYKKAGGYEFKAKEVKDFWKTNPTEEQEKLRSKLTKKAMYLGMIPGIIIGIGIMAFLNGIGII